MSEHILPKDIYAFLREKVLGQDEVLRVVSVAMYKHISSVKAGNVLLIGNSGTGKTTIMKAMRQFYQSRPELEKYQAMSIMNANILKGEEEGEVNTIRLFKKLEEDVRGILGLDVSAALLKQYMENATICIDEVDKISALIAGKVNASGIAIQQALLTLLEGETLVYETTVTEDDRDRRVKLPIDTGKLMFLAGGAFEDLFNQVYDLILHERDDRRLVEVATHDSQGRIAYTKLFSLSRYLKLSDLFTFGMGPQFISRFSAIAILEDLGPKELRQIMLKADDSPYRHSLRYFKTLGIDLSITEEALNLLTDYARLNTRIGARALREVFNRIITPFEFDPFHSGKLEEVGGKKRLVIDREIVARHLAPPEA